MATRRKRLKVESGQVAAIPLRDGTFALLHVAIFGGEVIGVFFARRAPRAEQLVEGLEETLRGKPISRLAVTSDEIEDGHWPIIAHSTPTYPAEMLDTKGSSYTASIVQMLFEAYYGLRPWNESRDPKAYEKLLLPGVPIPPTIRFKRDFEADAATTTAAATTAGASPSPVEAEGAGAPITEGAAVIHIEMTYPGEALPSVALLHQRQALERALEAAGAGEVTDAGGGGGIMDIYLETDDVARAMPLVQAALGASELGKSARVEIEPPVE